MRRSSHSTPDVLSAFPLKPGNLEYCFACGRAAADLYQVCLRCCKSPNCLQVTKLLCHTCGDNLSSFYDAKGGSEEDHDVWLFHLTHRQRCPSGRPTLSEESCCVFCRQMRLNFTVFTSRCCNEEGALELKSIVCLNCLNDERRLFLTMACNMTIPDFSSYVFHKLTRR